ncbi:hypothetical protein U1Q18_051748 [Sarracenia purpurea var. burkii]
MTGSNHWSSVNEGRDVVYRKIFKVYFNDDERPRSGRQFVSIGKERGIFFARDFIVRHLYYEVETVVVFQGNGILRDVIISLSSNRSKNRTSCNDYHDDELIQARPPRTCSQDWNLQCARDGLGMMQRCDAGSANY